MLDAVIHSRIIADFEQVCATAGIQRHFLYESMKEVCGPIEIDWVTNFNKYHAEGCPGLLLNGVKRPDTRCQAITAALLRNYIDARVVPINTLIEASSDGGVPTPTVLLIPNLYITAMSNKMPAWRVQVIYELLLQRSTHSKVSVVYVEDLKSIAGVYGEPFRDFLSRFREVTV